MNITNATDWTAMMYVAMASHIDSMKSLLNCNKTSRPDCTVALVVAIECGNIECVYLLIEAGTDVNIGNALLIACRTGNVQIA